ncbi:MAG: rod shape-determining protein MreD [Candidatus Margulisiibacteriota bacterium]|nr:rod shape-determining protein MreD [Candidatus Margulisiibacteriota bacterium]
MTFLLASIYILVVLMFQAVIFARLNLFGVVPDLILVSVIIYSVFNSQQRSAIFSAGAGLLQDLLSFGVYFNTIVKVLVSLVVNLLKENFMGNEFVFSVVLVVVFTPLSRLFEIGILYFFGRARFDCYFIITNAILATVYNMLFVPVLFPIVKRISHA